MAFSPIEELYIHRRVSDVTKTLNCVCYSNPEPGASSGFVIRIPNPVLVPGSGFESRITNNNCLIAKRFAIQD